MSMSEVCALLGVSRASIYRRIDKGQLNPLPRVNYVRDKEALRFRREEVEAIQKAADLKRAQSEKRGE